MRRFLPLFFLVSFASVGAIFYSPALPRLSSELGGGQSAAQLSVTLFLIAYALGQLPYGALTNHLGRKRTIYVGAATAFVGSVICALAPNFAILDLGRVIQAIGMACGLTLAFTLVGDLYEGTRAKKIVALMVMSFALLPAFGIAIAGFLTQYLGWRSCLWALALYSLFIGSLGFLLPRTHNKIPVNFRGYLVQFANPLVLIGGTVIGLGTVTFYVFAAEAPFIAQETLGLTSSQFGLFNLISYAGIIIGSLLCNALAHRFSNSQYIWFSLIVVPISSLAMLLLFAFGQVSIWTLFIPAGAIFFSIPFSYSTLTAAITSAATDKSSASAVMSFLNMGWATIGVLILSTLDPKNNLMMPAILTTASLAMVLLYLVLRKFKEIGLHSS